MCLPFGVMIASRVADHENEAVHLQGLRDLKFAERQPGCLAFGRQPVEKLSLGVRYRNHSSRGKRRLSQSVTITLAWLALPRREASV